MTEQIRLQVATRSKFLCEYCRFPANQAVRRHQVDHIISKKHGGDSSMENLAYSCRLCNLFKGTDLTAPDDRGNIVRLFNPRTDSWPDHFRFNGAMIEALTSSGEATARLLRFNNPDRLAERRILIETKRI